LLASQRIDLDIDLDAGGVEAAAPDEPVLTPAIAAIRPTLAELGQQSDISLQLTFLNDEVGLKRLTLTV
jgi:hypothetical protein